VDRYEELGLTRSATAAEIRRTYKKLALLLHPDRQADPEMRQLAELQMRRLNESFELLLAGGGRTSQPVPVLDPWKTPPIIVVPGAPARGRWYQSVTAQSFWGFLAGAALATLFWNALPERAAPLAKTVESIPQAGNGGDSDLAQRIHGLEEQVAALRKPERAETSRAGAAGSHGWAGTWFYKSQPLAAISSDLPRSVSLQITDDGGALRGEYSATAGTPNSTVAFHFEGSGTGGAARLPWTGAHGSSGEIELRLLRPNVLEVRWWAYGTSTDWGETSSTAILRRVSTP
jgi:DnaJ domain